MPAPAQTPPAAPTPRRVATYTRCRYSRDDQHGLGLARQEAALRAYLASHPHWQPVADYQDHVDGDRYRPALAHALADAYSGRFDVLLITEPDRLSRRIQTLCTRIRDFDDAGVAVHSIAGRLDTATPVGRMMLAVLTVFAQDQADDQAADNRVPAESTAAGNGGTARRRRRSSSRSATPPMRRPADPSDGTG
jgi:DNA invertase Pin-like site-specific DNA recombinase